MSSQVITSDILTVTFDLRIRKQKQRGRVQLSEDRIHYVI